MNKKNYITMGPGAASLTLLVVMLSISVLGILSLVSSRNDARLSERSMDVAASVYELNVQAEEDLAALDAILAGCAKGAATDTEYMQKIRTTLPDDYDLEEREVSWTRSDDQRTLDLTAQILPLGEDQRLRWIGHTMTAGMEEIWD